MVYKYERSLIKFQVHGDFAPCAAGSNPLKQYNTEAVAG